MRAGLFFVLLDCRGPAVNLETAVLKFSPVWILLGKELIAVAYDEACRFERSNGMSQLVLVMGREF